MISVLMKSNRRQSVLKKGVKVQFIPVEKNRNSLDRLHHCLIVDMDKDYIYIWNKANRDSGSSFYGIPLFMVIWELRSYK